MCLLFFFKQMSAYELRIMDWSSDVCSADLPAATQAIPMALYDSILDTIGSTPVVRLRRLAPPNVVMYAKVESFNPGGSVKDRLAIAVILDAEARGPNGRA